jgi:hypothetical protein
MSPPALLAAWHPVRGQGRTHPERLAIFVQLETRLLEVLDHQLGELLLGIVGRVLFAGGC